MEHAFALVDRSHEGHETLVQGPELECGRLQTRWEHFLGYHRLRSFRRSLSSQSPYCTRKPKIATIWRGARKLHLRMHLMLGVIRRNTHAASVFPLQNTEIQKRRCRHDTASTS